jgi:hypothetical protein
MAHWNWRWLHCGRPSPSVDPCGQHIEPFMGSWPDLACADESVAGDSFWCPLPEGKRDHMRKGLLTVLRDQMERTVTFWPLFPHKQNDNKPLSSVFSDDGYQLEKFPADGLLQLRCRISLEKQFWKWSGDQTLPECPYEVIFSVGAPSWHNCNFCSCWDPASHNCSSSVGWHLFFFRAFLVAMATPAPQTSWRLLAVVPNVAEPPALTWAYPKVSGLSR